MQPFYEKCKKNKNMFFPLSVLNINNTAVLRNVSKELVRGTLRGTPRAPKMEAKNPSKIDEKVIKNRR